MNFNKKYLQLLGFLVVVALAFPACELDDLNDPNNPSITGIEGNATLAEIQNVVDGIHAGQRNNLPIYFDAIGVVGREFWRFSGSDPRYTTDLLGGGNAVLDAGSFYNTNSYASRYRVIRNCYILENAIANTTAALTDAERKAANGFSKTIRAYELLLAFNQQYNNGIRVNTADPDNLGQFESKDGSLNAIAALLDEANNDLANGGGKFPFALKTGIYAIAADPDAGVTPDDFRKFNRALAARVDAYRENWDGCIAALNASFLDASPSADLNNGCYYIYSQGGGDVLNEMFQAPTATGEVRVVQPSFVTDAEAGDDRLEKALNRPDVLTQAGLAGNYGFNVYASNTSSIPIIRNEELILLWAEAYAQKGDVGQAAAALNLIRNRHGLGNTAASDKAGLIDEMLKQRRYSLYGEGHRWVDMRRYGRLGQLPKDRPDDDVWESFPRPVNE